MTEQRPAVSVLSFFVIFAVIIGLVTLGEVATKWIEARGVAPPLDPAREREVSQLREQVEELADRVERLTEEQRFLTRLLEASPRGTALPEPEDHRTSTASGPPEGRD